MKTPKLNDFVDVGGCVGTITHIANEIAQVRGKFYDYVEDFDYSEPWAMEFNLNQFKIFDEKNSHWDLTKEEPICI